MMGTRTCLGIKVALLYTKMQLTFQFELLLD